LLSTDEDTITMNYKEKTRVKEVEIQRDNISKARIAIEF